VARPTRTEYFRASNIGRPDDTKEALQAIESPIAGDLAAAG
jgi:hypothetical protein